MPSGPGDVFELIRHGRARTRGDILDVTGLSRMTVAQRVDGLLAAGLIREAGEGGSSIAGEVWAIPAAGIGPLLAQVPPPLGFGTVALQSGPCLGFLAEPSGLLGAPEITPHGGWRAYLASR